MKPTVLTFDPKRPRACGSATAPTACGTCPIWPEVSCAAPFVQQLNRIIEDDPNVAWVLRTFIANLLNERGGGQ